MSSSSENEGQKDYAFELKRRRPQRQRKARDIEQKFSEQTRKKLRREEANKEEDVFPQPSTTDECSTGMGSSSSDKNSSDNDKDSPNPSFLSTEKQKQRICQHCSRSYNQYYIKKHEAECKENKISSEYATDNSGSMDNRETNSPTYSIQEVQYNQSDVSDERNDYAEFRAELRKTLRGRPLNMSDDDIQSIFSEFQNDSDNLSDGGGVDSDSDPMFSDHDSDDDLHVNGEPFSWVFTLCVFLASLQTFFCVSDVLILYILNFLCLFLSGLSDVVQSPLMTGIAAAMPNSLHKFARVLGNNEIEENFTKYVVCKDCHSLYDFNDCWEVNEGMNVSRTCTFVEFPKHTQPARRRPCRATLLEEITLPSGKKKLQGKLIYCYKSLEKSVQQFVLRKGYESDCERWRQRTVSDGVLNDVYDGRIWKKFESNGFLQQERSYGMMLNLDWFEPYDHVKYSVGAIYMVNLSLPRYIRFKRKNILLVGIIPDMKKEPPTNTFIRPLVDELNRAWKEGFSLKSFESPNVENIFKIALLCVGCDLPASRKLCGFLGHTANVGCSKCLKIFPGDFGAKNYGGFDAGHWPLRNDANHRKICNDIKNNCCTKTEKEEAESKNGARYSVLLELEYYDSISMTIIDPMHNLFLGTGKNMIKIYKDMGFITPENEVDIQKTVNSFQVPSDLGKIPQKIESKFSSLNADQLKNWILYFSLVSLKNILPAQHYECWQKFVLACRSLCVRSIRAIDIQISSGFLLGFCRKFEELYGVERVTPNMHLHAHLSDCILDYGPLYAFWLFSFERYNGMLGAMHTNNKRIESQIMRRFNRNSFVMECSMPPTMTDLGHVRFFEEKRSRDQTGQRGALQAVFGVGDVSEFTKLINMADYNFGLNNDWTQFLDCFVPHSSANYTLSDHEYRCLGLMYNVLYPGQVSDVSPSARKSGYIKFSNETFGSINSRTRRSSHVCAFWSDENGDIANHFSVMDTIWPGTINFFIEHIVYLNGVAKLHILANVDWYTKLEDYLRYSYGKPVEIWQDSVTLPRNASSFIPIQRLKCKILKAPVKILYRNYVAIIPRQRFLC